MFLDDAHCAFFLVLLLLLATMSLLPILLYRSFFLCSTAPSFLYSVAPSFHVPSLLPPSSVAPSPHTSVAPSHLHSRKSSMVSIRRYLHLLPPQIPHATSLFHLPFTHCHPLVANISIPNHSFCSCTSHRPSILLYYTTRLLHFFRSPRNKCYCCILSLVFALYVFSWVSPTRVCFAFFYTVYRYFFFLIRFVVVASFASLSPVRSRSPK